MRARIGSHFLSVGIIPLMLVISALDGSGDGEHEPLAVVSSRDGAGIQSVSISFDDTPEGSFPEGFSKGMTGEWKETQWLVQKIEGNPALAHVGFWDEDPEGVFPVAWVKDSRAKDLRFSARIFPVTPPASVEGSENDGSGIVFRFANPDNYYLLRLVPHETRVRFYKVENGVRSTLTGKDIDVPTGQWHELQITAQGAIFTAHLNGEELFTFEDGTFGEPGSFGVWCKPNNTTYFDDLRAEIFAEHVANLGPSATEG